MQSDNDYSSARDETTQADESASVCEEQQETTLQWLLDQDYAEQSDKVFALTQEELVEHTLSEYETEIANRPMFAGDSNADDLSSFLGEEIVMTSPGQGAAIYALSGAQIEAAPTEGERLGNSGMALDHTKNQPSTYAEPARHIDEGVDILGLAEEDDIGERFVVLQKFTQETPVESERCEAAAKIGITAPAESTEVSELEEEFDVEGIDDLLEAIQVSGSEEAPPTEEVQSAEFAEITEVFETLGEPEADDTFDLPLPTEAGQGPGWLSEFPPQDDVQTATEIEGELAPGPDNQQAAVDIENTFSADELLATQEILTEEDFDVFDYVAANEPPTDDDDFDQYLLRGEHLTEGDAEVGDIEVDKTEGIASVDPQVDGTIDYHEDFIATQEFGSASVTAITAVIGEVMEDVTAAVTARLNSLSLDGDSVQVEVMLGTDAESTAQCQRAGYLPILEITPEVPAALARLGQTEIDAIFVRLTHGDDDENWNGLFTEGFTPFAEAQCDDIVTALEDESLESVFDDWTMEEDIFEDLIASTETMDVDLPLDELETEEFTQSDSDEQAISTIFEEDIFSADLTEEFGATEDMSGIDVEALIDSLADAEADADIGEICGIAVDEFSEDNSVAEAEAPRELSAVDDNGVDTEQPEDSQQADLSWCIPADIKFSYTSNSAAEVFTDFLDAFIEEGASELEKLEDAIGEWEKDISNEPAYVPVPRILHTLKGIAKSIGLQRYGTLIHNFETLLDSFARPTVGQEGNYFRVINAWLDAAVKGFEHIESKREDIASELPGQSKKPVADLSRAAATAGKVEALEPVTAQANDASPQGQLTQEEKKRDKKLADEGARVLAAQQTIRMTPDTVDRLLSLTNEAQQLGVRSSQSTVKSKRAATELLGRLSLIRAHVLKIADKAFLNSTAKGGKQSSELDALEMDQYSELQEAADILREGVEDLDDLIRVSSRQNGIAEALLKQQASVISSLGSSIQATRVLPVSRLMPGLRRIVRNVSADLGKAVSFRVLSEVGTLDRDNYARCQTILEHMIRNALDHGIENPQDRAVAGKDATGHITIDASKQGADYIVSLSDDGRGIDPEFMRDTAHERGLDIDVDMLSDAEAIRLIFHKGFSTASAVSEISGRGVGMDIVLSELQHIGGDIEIDSKVGVGTTFKVRIPSNVTVNGALLVAAGEASYAIPLDGLIAVEHVSVTEFYEAIERGQRLSLFGMECEPAYLATICRGDSLPERSAWGATIPVIIAGNDKRFMAIAIDDVTQALELVIRSLGTQFSTIPGLAGGATTADGQSIIALDLNALVASVASDELSAVSLHTETEERMLVLVVDDSRTQRMVATSQFDTLGVETVTAENGLVAIDLLNMTHRLPDVVLLDIEMPVKDGIQTLREIRKSPRYAQLPVIMVTSRTGAKHRSLAQAAGCNGYMGKPFNFPKLVEQIDGLTHQKFKLC